MEIEHEVTTRDGEVSQEHFWLKDADGTRSKILRRREMVAAYEYVKDNPEKFPNLQNQTWSS